MSTTINFSVVSTETRKPRGGGDSYALYQIEVSSTADKLKWIVEKRYSELFSLHTKLEGKYKGLLAAFPGKKLLTSSTSSKLVQERRVKIDAYLRKIAETPQVLADKRVIKFFEMDERVTAATLEDTRRAAEFVKQKEQFEKDQEIRLKEEEKARQKAEKELLSQAVDINTASISAKVSKSTVRAALHNRSELSGVFTVVVEVDKHKWKLIRRDGAFVSLWHAMKMAGIDGPFPEDLCRNFDLSFVEKNRKDLDKYLKHVVSNKKTVMASPSARKEFIRFISPFTEDDKLENGRFIDVPYDI